MLALRERGVFVNTLPEKHLQPPLCRQTAHHLRQVMTLKGRSHSLTSERLMAQRSDNLTIDIAHDEEVAHQVEVQNLAILDL